jgi:hypothetical protein
MTGFRAPQQDDCNIISRKSIRNIITGTRGSFLMPWWFWPSDCAIWCFWQSDSHGDVPGLVLWRSNCMHYVRSWSDGHDNVTCASLNLSQLCRMLTTLHPTILAHAARPHSHPSFLCLGWELGAPLPQAILRRKSNGNSDDGDKRKSLLLLYMMCHRRTDEAILVCFRTHEDEDSESEDLPLSLNLGFHEFLIPFIDWISDLSCSCCSSPPPLPCPTDHRFKPLYPLLRVQHIIRNEDCPYLS